MFSLETFYQSKEWRTLREIILAERVHDDGFVYDEITGKPIVNAYDIILHHKIFLTEDNVNDAAISLNPENIQVVSHKTHNGIHNSLGYSRKEIFIVYGPPLAGKTTYVNSVKVPGDLIIDMDNIWQCISGCERYQKPVRLKAVAFGVRDYLMDAIKVRNGKWQNAYIIGGFPYTAERERIIKTYGAREVFLDIPKEECIRRLEASNDGRTKEEWILYIEEWFERYLPPAP